MKYTQAQLEKIAEKITFNKNRMVVINSNLRNFSGKEVFNVTGNIERMCGSCEFISGEITEMAEGGEIDVVVGKIGLQLANVDEIHCDQPIQEVHGTVAILKGELDYYEKQI